MSQSTVPEYGIESDSWQSISVSGGSFNQLGYRGLPHASSFAGGGSLSFIAGGIDNVTWMVIFNSSDPLQPSWVNVTDNSIPYFWGSATQYVRFGEAGVLVSVGGFVTESTSYNLEPFREMNNVQIYDIAARNRFTVVATGDIPPPRLSACSALSAAPDDSSFQMILYGGMGRQNILGDVYVLTMPAFRWIKIDSTPTNMSSMPRIGHFCSTYQDRQMLVVGGDSKHSPNSSQISCTDGYSVLRLLDTTTFQWQNHYPLQDTKYQVPRSIIDIIGGGPDGGAQPASAFSQTLGDNLAVFNRTIPRYDPDHPPKRNVNTTSPTAPATSPPRASLSTLTSSLFNSSSPSTTTIAGTSVGSVVGATLLGVAIWFFLIPLIQKRRK